MRIDVSGQHIDIGDALRAHITEHVEAGVTKYFDRALEANVVMGRQGGAFTADISVHAARGILMRSHAEAPDAYAAADQAIERLAKRLRRHKRRLKDHHKSNDGADVRRSGQHYVVASPQDDDDEDDMAPQGDAPAVIAEQPAELATLSPMAAVMRLDLADQPALVFLNAKHGGLNVVYRRDDGNIGWIDPGGDTQ